MVVSSTSMNVGMTTATATIQGLIARRLTAGSGRVTLLIGAAPGGQLQSIPGSRPSTRAEV